MTESTFLWCLTQHLAMTTLLAFMVLLVCRLVRVNAATRHVLWLLVLIRLIVPPVATWPWAIPVSAVDSQGSESARPNSAESGPPNASRLVSIQDVTPVAEAPERSRVAFQVDAGQQTARGHHENATVAALTPDDKHPRHRWSAQLVASLVLVAFWAGGSLLVTVRLMRKFRQVAHLVRKKQDVSPWLLTDLGLWCKRLSLPQPVLVITEAIRSPFLWCLGPVCLVWPQSQSQPRQRESAQPILVHELAHLKRKDHWTAWVELIALILWWWNPVFWFVRRQLNSSAEMACDAWVVDLLPDQRRDYAESLIEFSRRRDTTRPAFGSVGADASFRHHLKKRLEMIMTQDSTTQFSKWTAMAVALLGVLSLPLFAVDAALEPPVDRDTALISETAANDPASGKPDTDNTLPFEPNEQDSKQDRGGVPGIGVGSPVVNASPLYSKESKAVVSAFAPLKPSQKNAGSGDSSDDASPADSASLIEVLNRIEEKYYGRVDRSELERAAIEAIISRLDDKSSVLTREQYSEMSISIDGNLVGVGVAIHLDPESHYPVITRPIRNSPGLASGLRRNDVIVSIDGEPTKGLSLKETVNRIRGPQGSSVVLGIQRGDETLDVSVVRERFETSLINPWSISADGTENYLIHPDDGIMYVHIPAFTQHTVPQLRKVIGGLENRPLKGLVLDLRDCAGGLLTAATALADLFVDEGIIMTSQGRDAAENRTYHATSGGDLIDLPLAVLVNARTASAAEIVAACLQDHHRAIIVGEQTYGRGTVQSLFPLVSGGALKLTTAAWVRPNGKSLLRREGSDVWGVQPDRDHAVPVTDAIRDELAQQRTMRLAGEGVDSGKDDVQLKQAIKALQRS